MAKKKPEPERQEEAPDFEALVGALLKVDPEGIIGKDKKKPEPKREPHRP